MKMITDFIHSIESELEVTYIKDKGYYYEYDSNTLNVAINDREDYGFIRHLKECHGCNFAEEFDLNFWSILHEIGHYEIADYIFESNEELELRFALALTDESIKDNKKIQDLYFNLTSEFEATEWAIEWIENNLDKAKNFNRLIELL